MKKMGSWCLRQNTSVSEGIAAKVDAVTALTGLKNLNLAPATR